MPMRLSPRSTFTRTLILLAGLLIASQIFSYLAVLNYALLPSLQQFNRIMAYEVKLMLKEDVELADGHKFHLDTPLRRQLLEQLGVTLHADDSPESAEFREATRIDYLSEEMTRELNTPTEVRLVLGTDSYVLWLDCDAMPGYLMRVPLSELQEEDFAPLFGYSLFIAVMVIAGGWMFIRIQNRPLVALEQAIGGFQKFADRAAENPDDLMPWKKLGQKWHFLRKGFPPGKSPQWSSEVLEELCETLSEAAGGDGQFLWNNQQVVHLFLKGQREPWASIWTKRLPSVDVALTSPKGSVALGRVRELGFARELDGKRRDRDVLVLKFRSTDDLHRGDLAAFLKEHLDSVTAGSR